MMSAVDFNSTSGMDEQRGRQMDRTGPRKTILKKKWGPSRTLTTQTMGTAPTSLPGALTTEQMECLLIRMRIEEITKKLTLGDYDLEWVDIDRSRSPEPIYDKEGKRTNTKDQRGRERLMDERQHLVEIAQSIYPGFKPPSDYVARDKKRHRKLMIPQERFPEYNFIGLIIGPRGNTQKRMERETGAKISIRGKGAVKDGKIGKNADDNEPLHVMISADNDASLDAATKAVRDLLTPVDEDLNEHKKKQLRELAEMNGTVRERMWGMIPTDERSFELANVRCNICGERSHVTSDCALKGKINPIAATDKAAMEREFNKFLEEIGDQPPPPEPSKVDDLFEQFKRAVGETVVTKTETVASSAPWSHIQMKSEDNQAPPPPPPPQQPHQAQMNPWQQQMQPNQQAFLYPPGANNNWSQMYPQNYQQQ